MLNVFATLGFCARTAFYVHDVNTGHRKFFHATVSLVVISGFIYEPSFTVLCGHLVIQIFIILEVILCRFLTLITFLDSACQFCRAVAINVEHLFGSVS